MATIKSYTDLEQSKKLAEILPLESADMSYTWDFDDEQYYISIEKFSNWRVPKYAESEKHKQAIPCWSLAALMDSLPNNEHISTTVSRGGWSIEPIDYMPNTWWCEYEDNEDYTELSTSADNQTDACYEMIIKLYEQKLL